MMRFPYERAGYSIPSLRWLFPDIAGLHQGNLLNLLACLGGERSIPGFWDRLGICVGSF